MAVCKQCGAILSRDEIGLHKKMIHRGATDFFCLRCLADYFQVQPEILEEKIRQFRNDGCLLFQ